MKRGESMQWEIEFLLWLQEVMPFKSLFAMITHLGDAGMFWIGFGFYLFFVQKDKNTALHLAFAIGLMALIVNFGLKPTIARVRPFDVYPMDLLVNAPKDFSFPSGHTAVSFASAYVLTACYPQFKIPAYILAGLIGISRMVLFVHYPTDVLGGLVIGLICGFISMKSF